MTRAAALAEAQRRWGSYGDHPAHFREVRVYEARNPELAERRGLPLYRVGWLRASDGVTVWEGSGDSYEAAFADADRRAGR